MRPTIVLHVLAALGAVFFIVAATIAFVPRAHAGVPCHGQEGVASFYGSESGSRTASGALFRPEGLSAAMPSRAMLGRRLRVTDQRTGRSIVVIINDVGPAARLHRIIDLSRGAARRLGMAGLARVCLETFP